MPEHDHILLKANSFFSSKEYHKHGGGKLPALPLRDAKAHSQMLFAQYADAKQTFEKQCQSLPKEVEPVSGIYADFAVHIKTIALESLDTSKGAKVMNIKGNADADTDADIQNATLFIPCAAKGKEWFEGKLNKYIAEPEQGKERANKKLIDSIEGIRAIDLPSFFTHEEDYPMSA